jgi:hypothetical protein
VVSSLGDIENPMVIDKLWKEKEQEPKVIGDWAGCQEDILSGKDVYEFDDYGEIVLIHQKSECCQHYVAEMSVCRIAGEE